MLTIFLSFYSSIPSSEFSTASTMSSLLPAQQAVLNAYAAACAEVPRDLRRSLILIGGAASIAHGMSERKTKDADILVSSESLAFLDDAIVKQRGGFHKDTDGVIKWDERDRSGQVLFSIQVELAKPGRKRFERDGRLAEYLFCAPVKRHAYQVMLRIESRRAIERGPGRLAIGENGCERHNRGQEHCCQRSYKFHICAESTLDTD